MRYTDIKPTLKSKADAILPFFGEDCTVKIFHRRWQFREEGLKKFIEQIPNVFDQGESDNTQPAVNSAVLSTIVEIFKDKVQQIIMLSFDASEAYIEQLMRYSSLTVRSDQAGFERFITYMIDRLTDQKVSLKTQKLYMRLFEVKQLDGGYLSAFLFKQASFINKNHINSVAHLSVRLRIIESLLTEESGLYTQQLKKLTAENFPSDHVNPAILACSAANNLEHRRQA